MNENSGRLPIYLVSLAAICILLFGIRAAAPILNPILLAVVITITVLPIPGLLTRRGLPGWLALVLTILVVVLLMALVIATVFFSVTKLATELPAYLADAAATAATDVSTATGLANASAAGSSTSTTEYVLQLGPIAQGFIATTLELLAQFGMALFIFFFMISAALSLPGAARLGLDPRAPTIGRISTLTGDIRHYMSILTVINLLVGLGDTVFLMVLGVDYALLWGLLAWFMGYIPSIGFIIALIPPVLMAYAQFGLQHGSDCPRRLHRDQRRRAELHPAQDDGPGLEDQSPGGVRRAVRLGLPARRDGRHPGNAADRAAPDAHGEFRRYARAGDLDALHRRAQERGTAAGHRAGHGLVGQNQGRAEAGRGT